VTFLQVSMNFGSLYYFLGIKSIEKQLKTPGTVLGQNPARRYSARHGGLPRAACWPGPAAGAARVLRRCVCAGHTGAWSPRVTCTRDGVVARSPRGRWWLAGGKVLPASSRGPPGGRQTRRELAELIEVVAQRWGGEAAWCGDTR
jgi:hypothetical protein